MNDEPQLNKNTSPHVTVLSLLWVSDQFCYSCNKIVMSHTFSLWLLRVLPICPSAIQSVSQSLITYRWNMYHRPTCFGSRVHTIAEFVLASCSCLGEWKCWRLLSWNSLEVRTVILPSFALMCLRDHTAQLITIRWIKRIPQRLVLQMSRWHRYPNKMSTAADWMKLLYLESTAK